MIESFPKADVTSGTSASEVSDPVGKPVSNPINDHDRALLTVAQAASLLQLSVSSIRKYIRDDDLKAVRVAGLRQVRIPREELLKLLSPA